MTSNSRVETSLKRYVLLTVCSLNLILLSSCNKKVEGDALGNGNIIPGATTGGTTGGGGTSSSTASSSSRASSSSSASSVASSSSSSSVPSSSSSTASSVSSVYSYSCNVVSPFPPNTTTVNSATLHFSCDTPSNYPRQCRIGSTSAWTACSSSTMHTVTTLPAGLIRFEVRTIHPTNGGVAASANYQWSITSSLMANITDSTRTSSPLAIKMNFNSSGGINPLTYECKLSDQSTYSACAAPWTPSQGTAAGATFTFNLKATDGTGTQSLVSKSWTNGNWPDFPGQPSTLTCGQTITYQRFCTQPTPSTFGSTTVTGLSCPGDPYKWYTRTCASYKRVAMLTETTVQNLRNWNQDCRADVPASLDFRDAIMKYCAANSYWNSGSGPLYIDPIPGNLNASPVKQACFTSDIATVLSVPNSTLTTANATCIPGTNTTSNDCLKAAHTHCRSLGHDAGFGPTQRISSNNQIVCLKAGSGSMIHTTFAALQGYHPLCDNTAPNSLNCRNAAHYFCAASGTSFETGVGLFNVSNGNADVYCVYREKQI